MKITGNTVLTQHNVWQKLLNMYTDIAKSWIYTQHNVIMDNTLECDGTVETVKATQS